MTFLLHLDASAHRSSESVSRALTALFADTWRSRHGRAGYRYRDLAAEPVAPIDTAFCALGRRVERHGLVPLTKVATLAHSPAERRAWALTRPLITELLAADTVLIGAPMYNYSVPAALKTWIDRVSFPGAFTDPDSGNSLLHRTTVVVITAAGGTYSPETGRQALDFHTPYLRAYFARQGVLKQNIRIVSAELTLAGLAPHLARLRPQADGSLATARRQVIRLATAATWVSEKRQSHNSETVAPKHRHPQRQ